MTFELIDMDAAIKLIEINTIRLYIALSGQSFEFLVIGKWKEEYQRDKEAEFWGEMNMKRQTESKGMIDLSGKRYHPIKKDKVEDYFSCSRRETVCTINRKRGV